MADLKISQLTGATTPLAGTEVVPLVQSSTTKKVTVANLTAGRAVGGLSFTSDSRTVLGGGGWWDNAVNGNNVGMTSGGARITPSDGSGIPSNNACDFGSTTSQWRNVYASSGFYAGGGRTFYGTAAFYDTTALGNNVGILTGGGAILSCNGSGTALDNSINLGNASFRWKEVFAGTGTINTSDGNEKQDVQDLDEAEKRVAQRLKSLVKKYRFRDSVAAKGDTARIHVGFIAQDVHQAFADEGLNAEQYGLFCRDVWYEVDGHALDKNIKPYTKETPNAVEKERLGLRYDELFAFVITAL